MKQNRILCTGNLKLCMLDKLVATSVTFNEEAPFDVSGYATVRVTGIGSH